MRDDQELRTIGWQMLDWGLDRQDPAGGFPTSAGLPRHTTAFFIEALARAALADPGAAAGPRTTALLRGARWLAEVRSPEDDETNDALVHRWWLVAAALAQAARALDDPSLLASADAAAARAVLGTDADGALRELGGHDVRYQAMGVLFASRYLLASPSSSDNVRQAVGRSLAWSVARVGDDGSIDRTGSTRAGNELTPNGHPKVLDLPRALEALVTGGHACRDAGALAAADRMVPAVAVAVRAQARDGALAERPRRLAFTFVCQGGALEPQALLLAATLREHVHPDHDLIAAVPGPAEQWAPPAPETIDALEALGVRVEPITNALGTGFPHANKIACLGVPTTADVRVFLDTDIACLAPVSDGPALVGDLAAKPSDLQAYTADRDVWEATYATAGLPLPSWQTVTSVSQEAGPPFFNSGLIVVPADAGPELATAWAAAAIRIRDASELPDHRRWSDQLGLAVAVADRNLAPNALDDRWNFPAHLRRIGDDARPALVHYHWPSVLREEPVLREKVRSLAATSPAFRAAAESTEGWRDVLAAPAYPERDGRPELLITGISRSGTSYLASILHRHRNCVVINEPDHVHEPLQMPVPWGLGTYLRRLRADVVDGRPVTNKLVDGRITEDTAIDQTVVADVVTVEDTGFVLGVKNTLAFLHHLDRIRTVLPEARVAICVRDPADTLASWAGTFPHLREVDLWARPHAHPDDPHLSATARARIAEIMAVDDLAWRRAHHWAFLAELVRRQVGRSGVIIVRYDDLVTDPHGTVARLTDGWPVGAPRDDIEPSRIRGRRSRLSDEERRAIRAVCAPAAAALGLDPG
jgi:hypothetical protein